MADNSYQVYNETTGSYVTRTNTSTGFVDTDSSGNVVQRVQRTSGGDVVIEKSQPQTSETQYTTTNEKGEQLGISIAPSVAEQKIKEYNEYAATQQSSAFNSPSLKRVQTIFEPATSIQQRQDVIKSTGGLYERPDSFVQAVEKQQAREQAFKSGNLVKAADTTSSYLSFGGGKPYSERSWIGQYGQNIVGFVNPLNWAVAGGIVASGAEKLYLTGWGLTRKDTRSNVLEELGRAGKETVSTYYNPLKPEGAATWTAAIVGGGLFAKTKMTSRAVNKPFDVVKQQGKSSQLGFVDVDRITGLRYTKVSAGKQTITGIGNEAVTASKTAKGSYFVVDKALKGKTTTVTSIPKEVSAKVVMSDLKGGRTGIGKFTKSLETGRTTIVEQINTKTLFGKPRTLFKVSESFGANKFRVRTYEGLKNFAVDKSFSDRVIYTKGGITSLGSSKVVGGSVIETGSKAYSQSSIVTTKKAVIGKGFVQDVTVKSTTTQSVKLPKPYGVERTIGSSVKEITVGKKGASVSGISDVTKRFNVKFGKESLEPNVVKVTKGKYFETKRPKYVSNIVSTTDINVKLSKSTIPAKTGKVYVNYNYKIYGRGVDVGRSFTEMFASKRAAKSSTPLRSINEPVVNIGKVGTSNIYSTSSFLFDIPKVDVGVRPSLFLSPNVRTNYNTIGVTSNAIINTPKSTPTRITKQYTDVTPITSQQIFISPKTTSILTPIGGGGEPLVPSTPSSFGGSTFKGGGLIIPPIGGTGFVGGSGKAGGRTKGRRGRYVQSLEAGIFGIKAKKVNPILARSGLVIRPIKI